MIKTTVYEPKNICSVCKGDANDGMSVSNINGLVFKHLKINEYAHIECYVDLCVQRSMEKMKAMEED